MPTLPIEWLSHHSTDDMLDSGSASVSAQTSKTRLRIFDRRTQLPLPAGQLWQIQSGVVRTQTWLADGWKVTLGIWGPGDVLGQPLASADPYLAECLTEVEVVPLPTEDWHQITSALIGHIRSSEELLKIVHYPQTEVALWLVLNWLSQRFGETHANGKQIHFRLTHQELAELIGTTRVTVTRLLSRLEKQGRIQRQHRYITVVSDDDPFWYYEI